MTPVDFQAELQRHADQCWPDAGIEVRVSVWRPGAPCERCGVALEREVLPDGALGARFHRTGEFEGMVVRQPHYFVHTGSR